MISETPIAPVAEDQKPAEGAQAPAVDAKAATPIAEQKPADGKSATPDKPKERMSASFAALAKKERALFQKQQQVKAQEEAAAEKVRAAQAFEASLKTAKLHPLKFLQEQLGYSWDDLVQIQLNGGPSPETAAEAAQRLVDERFAEMEEQRKQAEQEARVAEEAADQQAIDEFNQEVVGFIEAHPDDYELTILNGQQSLVLEVIQENFKANRKILTAQEAGNLVENYLADLVEKNLATKKWKARAGAPVAQKDGEQGQRGEQGAATRTLTNRMTPTAASQSKQVLSDEERTARARAAVRNVWAARKAGEA